MRYRFIQVKEDGDVVVQNRRLVLPKLGTGKSPVVVGLGVTGG